MDSDMMHIHYVLCDMHYPLIKFYPKSIGYRLLGQEGMHTCMH